MNKKIKKVLILTSGGIDSTACIKYYQDLEFEVEGLFIDFGQKSRYNEQNSVKKIAEYYGINLNIMNVDTHQEFSSGEIRGRNGFLIMTAFVAKPDHFGLISLGLHSGVPYYDCSKKFVKMMDNLIMEYSNGQLKLDFPFIDWDKKMVFSYCKDMNVPIHLTYSCEKDDGPCGKCQSCLDRKALNAI
jgi:7-cyano-7-deazaguanine synthase